MKKSIKLLIPVLILAFGFVIFGVIRFNTQTNDTCHQVTQTSKMDTSEELRNKVFFSMVIKNKCGKDLEFSKFQVIVKDKLGEKIISDDQYLEKLILVRKNKEESFNLTYSISESEFSNFYRYSLVPIQ